MICLRIHKTVKFLLMVAELQIITLHELRYTIAYRQCEGANQPMVDILICFPQPLHLSFFPLCSGLAQLVPETEGDGDGH